MRARVLSLAVASFSLAAAVVTSGQSAAATGGTGFLASLHTVSRVGSTVPASGDVNPYGVAVVRTSAGRLVAGDTLVSNFNDKANVQGTGKTIVEVSPSGSTSLFARLNTLPTTLSCPGGVGLTAALTILPGGWVVVGSLPAGPGGALPKPDPVGCLIVFNSSGTPVETFTNKDIVGPWDLAATWSTTSATLFVSNALGGNITTDNGVPIAGNCTILRIDLSLSQSAPPALKSSTVIGSDFPWRANQAAFDLAPTGLALGRHGTLFVDDTMTNSISAIHDALSRTSAVGASSNRISAGGDLNAPLGLIVAPNGDLVTVNGNNGNAVEFTERGKQIATRTLVKNGAGDLFGIALSAQGDGLLFVNDGTNALDLDKMGR